MSSPNSVSGTSGNGSGGNGTAGGNAGDGSDGKPVKKLASAQSTAITNITIDPDKVKKMNDVELNQLAKERAKGWAIYYNLMVRDDTKFITEGMIKNPTKGFMRTHVVAYGVEKLSKEQRRVFVDAWEKSIGDAMAPKWSAGIRSMFENHESK